VAGADYLIGGTCRRRIKLRDAFEIIGRMCRRRIKMADGVKMIRRNCVKGG
jgi:predicted transcriptional regulator